MTSTAPFPAGTILGYPRIGPRRELKKAVESFWAGTSTAAELEATAAGLRQATRDRLAALGLGRTDSAIPESFSYYDQVLDERVVPVTGVEMLVELEHVPPGRYIVAVSHDANSNRIMDTGWFGIPTEAYGFSRGARGTFGPPGFEDGAFDFAGGRMPVPVAVR